jgi:hypothetical protein
MKLLCKGWPIKSLDLFPMGSFYKNTKNLGKGQGREWRNIQIKLTKGSIKARTALILLNNILTLKELLHLKNTCY